ncbi:MULTISPECIES: DegT/DnrJ/EryC1/StrS family aminotransferase [Pacificibacter]|uniref:DegT/DnrJ/EryC1/StrS family aminotransferase n=1 Tax=Pacificibacter TaxID=1042323 RepID=UPI001C08E468|nr:MULTISPECIES: DegT/DnrJ/EryC1/StrS family aminotransferase [Pacificibacter]MBU2936761.1 DegT/DnrJ/EryC1/StrS family aminotransferase [Pacificibacter marinus]MDO6614752.1 DegT/DnrJ/EryC1/StrS family aminotransferase [Pacificibacter sp. 1_MG-2023]
MISTGTIWLSLLLLFSMIRLGSSRATLQVVVQIADRDRICEELRRKGVPVGIHYPVPCHMQPAITSGAYHVSLPRAQEAAGRGLSLPSGLGLSDEVVLRIADHFNDLVE